LFDVDFIPYPKPGCEEESVRTLNEILRKDDCAAFVYEPLVQGVSGFSMAAAKAFDPLLALCRSYDVISIADEVMTGFGRTGSLFASEQMEHAPDIMCLSKGITGGVLPLAVTSCSDRIYQAFWDDSKEKAFLHGHSYAANAVACAAACASLDLLLSEESRSQRKDIERCFDKVKDRFNGHPKLAEVRHKGCLIAFEIKDNSPGYFSSYATRLQKFYRDNWVLLRPLGNVIYMIPPYCINSDQIDMVSEVIWNSLELIDG
jgi:adenosylmethionine-8-amino-7-oxononanoate aminotransferase